MVRWRILIALLATVMSGTAVTAHDDHQAATPEAESGTGTALIYLTIRDTGTSGDTLVSATTDAAERVTLHTTEDMNGMSHMAEQANGFAIEPGGTLELARGGSHLMLENLRQDLRVGDTYEVTLTFATAGDVTLSVTVGVTAPEGISPVTAGDLEISAPWSLPAPMLAVAPTEATPEATPAEHHH